MQREEEIFLLATSYGNQIQALANISLRSNIDLTYPMVKEYHVLVHH